MRYPLGHCLPQTRVSHSARERDHVSQVRNMKLFFGERVRAAKTLLHWTVIASLPRSSSQGNLFNDILEAASLDSAPGVPTGWGTTNTAKWLLWEDPLLTHLSPQV